MTISGALGASACSSRMGHNVEDLTVIESGPLAGQLAALDGYDVYLSPTQGSPKAPKKAFDLHKTSISGGPRGIAYVPELASFIFTNPRKPEYLLRTDAKGKELSPLKVQYPSDYKHYHSEGLTYLPHCAPKHGGKILMVGVQLEPEFKCRLFVLNLEGIVEDEIQLEGDLHQGWIASVAYDQQGGLWVSQGDNKLHHFDLDGKKLQEPVEVADAHSLEGVATTKDGSLFVGDLFDGQLRHLDKNLKRNFEHDRVYAFGHGASFPLALAWRPDLKRIAVQHLSPKGFRFVHTPVDLKSVEERFILEKDATYESSMTWIDSEGRYAVVRKASGEVWFVNDDGAKTDMLDLSEHMPIVALDYIPSQQQFALLSGATDDEQELRLLSRDGTTMGEFDLMALSGIKSAVSMATYTSKGKPVFVIAQTPEQGNALSAFDLDGTVHWTLDYRKELGVIYPANTTVIDADVLPSFAVSDPGSSKISVFTPPDGE